MRKRVVGTTIGALALAAGCATSSVSRTESQLEATPAPKRSGVASTRIAIDSTFAQAIADREGPRVSIRAQVTQLTGTRRLRAAFNVEDDAYVLVGHVDAGGVVRVVFPTDPHDDGFVQGGGKSYQTAEFFAGFSNEYAYRYSTFGRYNGLQRDSYDGGAGYLFIIASWRPMDFTKLSSGGDWDSFEVTTEAYIRDPRPAIQELASVLVGENREAFTVKFAPYYSTQDYSPFSSYAGYSSFGLGLCNASFYGWGQSIPWSYLSVNAPFLTSGLGGGTFFYRGRRYAYDSLGDCAVPLPYSAFGGGYYGYPTVPRIASNPVSPGRPGTDPITGRARVLGATDVHRNPFEPQAPGRRLAPEMASDGSTATQGVPARVSPEYRNRGLITADEPQGEAPRSMPRVGNDERTRPSIQQMTQRRAQNAYDGSGYTRSRLSTDDGSANGGNSNAGARSSGQRRIGADASPRNPVERPQVEERARYRDPQQPSPGTYDNPRSSSPRTEQPRTEQPRTEQPRSEQPRSEQPMRSAPPPRPEPRSEPRSEPRAEPRQTPSARSAEPRSSEPQGPARSTPPASSGSKPPL